MLEIIAIDHVVLRTSRLEEMLAFYCGVLGCNLERQLAPEVGLYQLRAGSSLIDIVPLESELGRLGGGPPSQDGRNMEHFCLTVAGVDEKELLDYLGSKAVRFGEVAERYGASGYSRSVYVDDPEGNIVELKLLP